MLGSRLNMGSMEHTSVSGLFAGNTVMAESERVVKVIVN